MSKKLPALQFYVGDWRKDPGVQALDYEARGVWLELLCLMHESDDRGRLLLNGQPMPDAALAQNLGLPEATLKQILSKIEAYGVASRDPDTGALYCRRMVRDEDLRRKKAEAGRIGGSISKPPPKQTGSKNEAEGEANGGSSVSVSVSPSGIKRPFPKDWEPNDNHQQRAGEYGLDLDLEAEKFENHAISGGRKQIDWDRAFTNWLIQAKEFADNRRPKEEAPDTSWRKW